MSGPVFTSTPPSTATEGVFFSYAPTATDSTSTPITSWSIAGNPVGMFINTSSGLVTWTPPNYAQTVNLVVTAHDSTALKTDQSFSVTVGQNNLTPSLSLMTQRENNWRLASNGFGVGLSQNIS
jgi:large repetitive protein